jgi:TetR/AcrR family transcriptional regulator
MTRKRNPGTDERLEQLLESALGEFARKSYEEASLNGILKDAGISKGVFYHYFKDKLALYQALLQRLADTKVKVLSQHTDGNLMPRQDEDLFDYFERMLSLNAIIAAHSPLLYRFAVRYSREAPEFRHQAAGGVGNGTDFTAALIAHGLSSGTFDPSYPPEFVKAVFTYFIEHVFDLMPLNENISPEEVELRMALLFRLMRNGLGRKQQI